MPFLNPDDGQNGVRQMGADSGGRGAPSAESTRGGTPGGDGGVMSVGANAGGRGAMPAETTRDASPGGDGGVMGMGRDVGGRGRGPSDARGAAQFSRDMTSPSPSRTTTVGGQ